MQNFHEETPMRWLIWYFRSLFCSHTWEFKEKAFTTWYSPDIKQRILAPEVQRYGEKDVIIVSATCSKCGWHRSYSKFGT